MPQPTFTSNIKFGNNALPNGQGTQAWILINDAASWFAQDIQLQHDNRKIGIGQQLYLSKGVYLRDDFAARRITLPMRYYEGPGTALGAALAQLSQAGEQYLTFDNGSTGILAKYAGIRNRKMSRKFSPYWWDFDLDFVCRIPFFTDIAATTPAGSPWAVTGTTAGSTTSFTITYAGSVFTSPTFTLTIPNTSTGVLGKITIKNTMSGEALTVSFPGGLTASTAWSITFDCGAWTVKDGSGKLYDVTGSFPQVYGPVSTANTYQATLTTNSGSMSSTTLGASIFNRWEA